MFRFDSFKKINNENTSVNTNNTEQPTSFLQRIASSDTLLKSTGTNRPTLSKSASSASTTTAQSFSIPMPTNSWGMLTLSRLQDPLDSELDDIVDLLFKQDEATLLLPVSGPSLPSTIVDRDFIMDHVLMYKDHEQFMSLSGIRGIFQKDQFIALGLFPSEKDKCSSTVDRTNQKKKSLFDTFSLDPSSITPDHPKYNILASHVQLPLRNDKLITVMLIQKPLSKNDIMEWIATKAKNDKSMNTPLIDPLSAQVDEFIHKYKKNPPKTTDISSDKILDFLEDMRDAINDENDVDRLDIIETYICHQLYDYLFTHPDGDEAMQDEALESRIAALNLLDLDLNHLGVSFDDEEKQFEDIAKLAGTQLQQLNTMMGAKEKLQALVKTHQIIVDAVEGFSDKHRHAPTTTLDDNAEVVQEMKHAMATVHEEEKKPSQINADVLLPILIFTIVKSNPTHFLSNLKFIQRYRRPDQLRGQASYCLTNMMAAVSFLETTNLVGLGLSADRVFSHITDLNATKLPTSTKTNQQHQQQQSIAGLRIVSDVMDSSYKVFDGLGKFWQRNAQELESNKAVSGLVGRVRKVSDAAHSITKEGLSELKEMTNSVPTNTDDTSSSASSLPSFMEHHRHKKQSHTIGEGPITKFLEMKSVEELKIGEVTELLADYKRLAAIIKQANLA